MILIIIDSSTIVVVVVILVVMVVVTAEAAAGIPPCAPVISVAAGPNFTKSGGRCSPCLLPRLTAGIPLARSFMGVRRSREFSTGAGRVGEIEGGQD